MGCTPDKDVIEVEDDLPIGPPGKPETSAPYRTNVVDPLVKSMPEVKTRMRNVPPVTFLKTVAKMIENNSGNDFFLRAKRAHDWVATHITTDRALGKKFAQTADDVIRSGVAKSEGFANVMKALCDELMIPCEVIHGCIRGPGWSLFDPENNDLSKKNHSWNKVMLLGAWYLLDVSYDSGYLDAKGLPKAYYSTTYFLADPARFVRDHFPLNPANQLLENPISPLLFSEWFVTHQTFWSVVSSLDPMLPRMADAPYGWLAVQFTLQKDFKLGFYVRDGEDQPTDPEAAAALAAARAAAGLGPVDYEHCCFIQEVTPPTPQVELLDPPVKAGEVNGGEVKAGEAKAGEAKAGEAKAGEAKAGEVKAEEAAKVAAAGEVKAGEVKAGELPKEAAAGEKAAMADAEGQDGKQWWAFLSFPRAGRFLVRMFWGHTDDMVLESCGEFGVTAGKAGPVFPKQTAFDGVTVVAPMDFPLKTGKIYNFTIMMTEDAVKSTGGKLAVVFDEKFNVFGDKEYGIEKETKVRVYTKSMAIEEGTKVVKICAGQAGSEDYQEIMQYDVFENLAIPPPPPPEEIPPEEEPLEGEEVPQEEAAPGEEQAAAQEGEPQPQQEGAAQQQEAQQQEGAAPRPEQPQPELELGLNVLPPF